MDIQLVQREWEQVLNASAPEPVDSDCEVIDPGPEPNLLCLGLESAKDSYILYTITFTIIIITILDLT